MYTFDRVSKFFVTSYMVESKAYAIYFSQVAVNLFQNSFYHRDEVLAKDHVIFEKKEKRR